MSVAALAMAIASANAAAVRIIDFEIREGRGVPQAEETPAPDNGPVTPVSAPLELNEFRTEAYTHTYVCPSYCTGGAAGKTGGGKGQALAQSDFAGALGNARSYASLTGGFETPVLKAEATAFALGGSKDTVAAARAIGVQGYTYNGPDTQLTLDVRLTGDLYDPGNSTWAKLSATVLLFEARDFEHYSDVGTILYESSSRLVKQADGNDARVDLLQAQTGTADKTASITINATKGNQFYIWADLQAVGRSWQSEDSVADAFHTLTSTFTDSFGNAPVGLVSSTAQAQGSPGPAAIPVSAPATLALALPGLLGLGFCRRTAAA